MNDLPNTTNEEKSVIFFNDIKSELGLKSSRKVARVVKKVFGAVQKNLSVGEIKTMLMKLPDFLQLVFIGEWQQSKLASADEHLDQWVDTISLEDQSSEDRVFHSEVEILKAIVITMTKLDKICGVLSFPGFKFSLAQEIKQASF